MFQAKELNGVVRQSERDGVKDITGTRVSQYGRRGGVKERNGTKEDEKPGEADRDGRREKGKKTKSERFREKRQKPEPPSAALSISDDFCVTLRPKPGVSHLIDTLIAVA